MSKSKRKTTYALIKRYLPSRYLIEIKEKTGASISLINMVLRDEREDKKGIIKEAYRIANEEKIRQENDAIELAILKESFNTQSK